MTTFNREKMKKMSYQTQSQPKGMHKNKAQSRDKRFIEWFIKVISFMFICF